MIASPARFTTIAQLQARLGNIPGDRVHLDPAPGHATIQDLIQLHKRRGTLAELVSNTIVEKAMGFRQSFLAAYLLRLLGNYVASAKLGLCSGPDTMLQILPGTVRLPDLCFISWDRLPGGVVPEEPVPELVPNLAVEVLNQGNTLAEMVRKREEYFEAGVEQVWLIDVEARTVEVFTGVEEFVLLQVGDSLSGGTLLRGWSLPLAEIFACLDETAPQEGQP